MVSKVRYILSIDGGGIRGIIPATILSEVEKRAKRPLGEMFDLVAGTSTGGIVASALCKKDARGKYQYSAESMVDLYKKNGPKIFDPDEAHTFMTFYKGALYDPDTLEATLHQYFGNDTLGSISTKLLLVSYDMNQGKPMIFKSWKTTDVKIKDAIRASTAAPTYFAPKKLFVSQSGGERCLIDGGVIANNPAACAYAAGRRLYPNDDIVILSVGCGWKFEPTNCDDVKGWGKMNWIMPIIDLCLNGSSDCICYQLEHILGNNFLRIEPKLEKGSSSIDDSSNKNLQALIEDGKKAITEHSNIIDRFLNLKFNFTT